MSGRQFVYRKVVKGKEVLLPWLRGETELYFHNHQEIIDRILRRHNVPETMKVIIHPNRDGDYLRGAGNIFRGIGILLFVAVKEEMVLTLLHEIAHYHHPELHDDEIAIERIALQWYGRTTSWYLEKMLKERNRLPYQPSLI